MISTAPPQQASIDVRGLTKVYPQRRGQLVVLREMSFAVRAGEFCALIGPSGCGKTTLLHILAGLTQPTAGQVQISRNDGGRLPTALIFQGVSTLPWMTALDNVGYGLRLMGVPGPERRERARHHLARVGLAEFSDAFPHQLSEGMRQRVSIARALATDPGILLMDEPFANLDEQNRMLLQDELLRIWQDDRKTVVFVTHSLDEAIRLADRVLVMSATPSRIKTEIAVPFGRPRDFRVIRQDAAYGTLSARLWDDLREEVLRSPQP
jgi:NitT/TauT family transport system ATP-binding protein